MARKRINVDAAIAQILSQEEEDIDGSYYWNESDFDTEDDGESSENDDNICDDNNLQGIFFGPGGSLGLNCLATKSLVTLP